MEVESDPPGPTRAKKARTEYCAYYIFTLRKTVVVLVMLVMLG